MSTDRLTPTEHTTVASIRSAFLEGKSSYRIHDRLMGAVDATIGATAALIPFLPNQYSDDYNGPAVEAYEATKAFQEQLFAMMRATNGGIASC